MVKIKAEFKINGLQQLQEKFLNLKKRLEIQLDSSLLQLCEEAIAHAKRNKGYKDQSSNLKNTISFAFFKDGELVTKHIGENTEAEEKGYEAADPAFVSERLEEYCNMEGVVRPKGYSLVIVAPMIYAHRVEHEGYNVLQLTKYFLQDGIKKELSAALDNVVI